MANSSYPMSAVLFLTLLSQQCLAADEGLRRGPDTRPTMTTISAVTRVTMKKAGCSTSTVDYITGVRTGDSWRVTPMIWV